MAQQNPKVLDGSRAATMGIVGDRNPELRVHLATEAALSHVPDPLPFEWIPTEAIAARPAGRLSRYAALLISPGSPYRSMEGALAAIPLVERVVATAGRRGAR